MKQTSFLIEIVLKDDSTPAILIRDPRGAVVKITSDPKEVESFLCETIEKLSNFNPTNN